MGMYGNLEISGGTTSGASTIVHQVNRTFTDSQIQNAESSYLSIVDPTETLNYTAAPSRLFLPVSGFAVIQTSVAYGNVNPNCHMLFVWGDWDISVSISQQVSAGGTFSAASLQPWFQSAPQPNTSAFAFYAVAPAPTSNDNSFNDNGLRLVFENGGDGPFTGGDSSNTFDVSVEFRVYDFTLKRFITTDESGWDQNSGQFL